MMRRAFPGVLALLGPLMLVGDGAVVAQAPSGTTHVITQRGSQFDPPALTIRKGDTIIFVNDDNKPHHVVSHTPSSKFDLDLQKPGERSPVMMNVIGEIVVSCDIHRRMETIITVKE